MVVPGVLAFVLLLAALVYLFWGSHALVRNPKATTNRLVTALATLFALWALVGALRNLTDAPTAEWLWIKSGVLSWSMGSALLLHFVLRLTSPTRVLRWPWVAVTYGALGTAGVIGLTSEEDWFLAILGTTTYFVSLVMAVVRLSLWGRRSSKAWEKKQALWASRSLLTTALAMVIWERGVAFLVPGNIGFVFPLFPLIWTGGLWWTVVRYGLLDFHPALAADHILENVLELVILIDHHGELIKLNSSAARGLGYETSAVRGRPFGELVQDPVRVREALEGLFSGRGTRYEAEFSLRTADGSELPVRAVCTSVGVPGGAVAGVVLSALDLRAEKRLWKLSTTDKLTEIPNRSFLEGVLDYECARSQRSVQAFSLLLLDIDFFKQVNDRLGHQAGDEVLRGLARILAAGTRESDTAGRWGGEEFLVVLPDTGPESAWALAEKLHVAVGTSTDPALRGITVSIGVATWVTGDSADSLFRKADRGLYRAKENGRDRVEVCGD